MLKARKAYFRSWDHQLMQEAYPFTVKPKGQARNKQDFLQFGEAGPGATSRWKSWRRRNRRALARCDQA